MRVRFHPPTSVIVTLAQAQTLTITQEANQPVSEGSNVSRGRAQKVLQVSGFPRSMTPLPHFISWGEMGDL